LQNETGPNQVERTVDKWQVAGIARSKMEGMATVLVGQLSSGLDERGISIESNDHALTMPFGDQPADRAGATANVEDSPLWLDA
jgi:hypothetical protein